MVEFGLEIGFGLGGKSLEFLYVYLWLNIVDIAASGS